MYSFILGFQRLVWCPKCTPASSNSFMVILAKQPPFKVCILRSPRRTPDCFPVPHLPVTGRIAVIHHRSRSPANAERATAELPLAVLEALARTLLSVLLTLFAARVAADQSFRLQLFAQLHVELHQRASNP